MLRLPAVAGRFYPSHPAELTALIRKYSGTEPGRPSIPVRACLVPHAGYVYSGHVAGAVLARIALPRKIIVLGVRHYPRGEPAAILSSGAWRTPLGDARIDETLAETLKKACPLLREDSVAHSEEQALEPRGLYDTCRNEEISMCGLGPAVAMITALNALGAKKSELVKYATSADVSGDRDAVVGYAGMIF